MKQLFFLAIILSMYNGFSQKKELNYLNSGALSKNVSCGIGEIFIIQTIKPEEKKVPENYDNVIVYPNPVKEILFINSSSIIKQVELYSIEGKLISNFDVFNNRQINITHLHSGIYILKSSESIFEPIKIIKE